MNIKFARGWALTPLSETEKLKALPEYFMTERLNGDYNFSHDAILEHRISKAGELKVIFIGLAYDIDHIELDAGQICARLAALFNFEQPFARDFISALDALAGRFAVICVMGDKCWAFNDCNGMQSIFYHKDGNAIASHYGIINILYPEKLTNDYAACRRQHAALKISPPVALPGDLTPYEDIFVLVPNNALYLPGSRINRYFPLEKMEPVDYRDVVIFIAEKLKLLTSRLNRDYRIYESLTFGMDSRTTLSAVREIRDDITFFTYYYSGATGQAFLKYDSENNLAFSRRAAKTLGLNLMALDMSKYNASDAQAKEFIENHYIQHHYQEVLAYADIFREKNAVHLRSNVYEMLKYNYYHISPGYTKRQVAAYLTNYTFLYQTSPIYKEVFDYYSDYIDKYNVMDLLQSGYNYGDLFYMEHRDAQWLAACVAETDPALPTYLPINCGKLIKLALSIPKQLRDRDILQNGIISHNWPELLDSFKYPNNPEKIASITDYEMYRDRQVYPINDYVNNKHNFEIKSYNPDLPERGDFHYIKSNFDNIIVGFSSASLMANDSVALEFSFPLGKGKAYYLSFCVYTGQFPYLNSEEIYYEIHIDSELKYSTPINEFAGTNKFDYLFTRKDNDKLKATIKLISRVSFQSQFANSLIKINNLIFRPDSRKPARDCFLSSRDSMEKALATTTGQNY